MIFLAFVVPLAIYCFILALLNRSRHPVMVPGSWDFAGVLLAASGLLLLGGPAILSGIYEQWRLAWLLGRTRILPGLGDHWYWWIGLWVLYFVIVLSASVFLLLRRRALTAIYNVDPAVVEELLFPLLNRLGVESVRNGPSRVLIRACEPAAEEKDVSRDPAPVPIEAPELARAVLDLESFKLMRHMTLRWSGESAAIRSEVEAELAKALAEIQSPDNPAGAWFMSVAVSLFFLIFFALLGLLFLRILQLLQ